MPKKMKSETKKEAKSKAKNEVENEAKIEVESEITLEQKPLTIEPPMDRKQRKKYCLEDCYLSTGEQTTSVYFRENTFPYLDKKIQVVENHNSIKKTTYSIDLKKKPPHQNCFEHIVEELIRNDFVILEPNQYLKVNFISVIKPNTFTIYDYDVIDFL